MHNKTKIRVICRWVNIKNDCLCWQCSASSWHRRYSFYLPPALCKAHAVVFSSVREELEMFHPAGVTRCTGGMDESTKGPLYSSMPQISSPSVQGWGNGPYKTLHTLYYQRTVLLESIPGGEFMNDLMTIIRHILGQNLTTTLWPIHKTF